MLTLTMVASNAKILLGILLGLDGKNEVIGDDLSIQLSIFPILQVFSFVLPDLLVPGLSLKLHVPKENVISAENTILILLNLTVPILKDSWEYITASPMEVN